MTGIERQILINQLVLMQSEAFACHNRTPTALLLAITTTQDILEANREEKINE